MSNKYICPVCGKLQVIVPELVSYSVYYGGNRTYYNSVKCKVCGWKYEDDSSDKEKDPSVIYDRACYEYEKAKQGAIDATQRLASAASDFVKGNSTIEEQLKEILAELKKTNDYIYSHEQNRIAQDVKEHEKVLHSMKAEKEFAEEVLPRAGIGYLGGYLSDKEETDGN